MSREHVQKIYNQSLASYLEMIEILAEYEEALKSDKITNEQRDNIKTIAGPIINNYQFMSRIMYELNKPSRSGKLTRYEKRMANKLKRIDPDNEFSPEAIQAESNNALSSLVNELLHYNDNISSQQEKTFDDISNWALSKFGDSEGEVEVMATLGEEAFNYYKSIYEDSKID